VDSGNFASWVTSTATFRVTFVLIVAALLLKTGKEKHFAVWQKISGTEAMSKNGQMVELSGFVRLVSRMQ
jgi:hypothetical protein